MKILFVHADYLRYEVKRKTRFAEKLDEAHKANEVRDPLVAFICVEKKDERSGLTEECLAEIENVADKVKTKNIVLFPFAHLSQDLASPGFALETLTDLERRLKEKGYSTRRVPFGWYKVFEFRTKGHPLALLSRSIPNQLKKDH